MSFEVFVRPPGGRQMDKIMRVRVGEGGKFLHLNTKAYRTLGSPNKVLLLRDGKSIAFEAADMDDARAFPCPRGSISCPRFIEEMDLMSGMKITLRSEGGMLRSDGLNG